MTEEGKSLTEVATHLGIARSDRASQYGGAEYQDLLDRSKRSGSTTSPSTRELRLAATSSTISKLSTIVAACTPRSATAPQ